MQNFSLIQIAAEGDPHVALQSLRHFLVLALLFGVALLDCRGRRPRRPVYKNIIAICTGSRGRLPLQVWWFLNIIPVGEGYPLPTNLCKSGRRNASPTDKTSKFTTNLVGTGVPDGPKRADMESAPTDLNVVLKFVCRGGYYPPVYDNPSVIFLRK